MMRCLFVASLSVAALSVSAIEHADAADLPVKAPAYSAPAVVPAPSWTGWYVGVAGGGAWGGAEQTDSSPFSSGHYDTSGGVIGGTLGYNWQTGPVVLGVETDFSYAAIKGSTTGTDRASGTCGGAHCESDIRYFGTLRGRLGLAWDNLLPYVTGGLAYANVHGEEGPGGAIDAFGSGSDWIAGWTIGGGIEGKFASNWSAKLEYLYADLKGDVFTANNVGGVAFSQNLHLTTHVVRVGINYHF